MLLDRNKRSWLSTLLSERVIAALACFSGVDVLESRSGTHFSATVALDHEFDSTDHGSRATRV